MPGTNLVVEQVGYGVAEDLPQQPAGQVPEVTRSHLLYGVTLCELRKDDVDAVAQRAQIGASLRVGISLLGAVGCEKLYALTSNQPFLGLGRVVVAVSDGSRGTLQPLRW
jgi:hypothetical protein